MMYLYCGENGKCAQSKEKQACNWRNWSVHTSDQDLTAMPINSFGSGTFTSVANSQNIQTKCFSFTNQLTIPFSVVKIVWANFLSSKDFFIFRKSIFKHVAVKWLFLCQRHEIVIKFVNTFFMDVSQVKCQPWMEATVEMSRRAYVCERIND